MRANATDGRTPYRYIDPAQHTLRVVSIMRQHLAVWFRRAVNERLADGGSEVVVELC